MDGWKENKTIKKIDGWIEEKKIDTKMEDRMDRKIWMVGWIKIDEKTRWMVGWIEKKQMNKQMDG